MASFGGAVKGSSPHARGAPPRGLVLHGAVGDHPRMRGEHHGTTLGRHLLNRIIPACAGSTSNGHVSDEGFSGSSPHARGALALFAGHGRLLRDHPRMRGEHSTEDGEAFIWRRIIPACAGSTCPPSLVCPTLMGSSPHARGARTQKTGNHRPAKDHPRMRGEHHRRQGRGQQPFGIIPACAGSTLNQAVSFGDFVGSSPHARGALFTPLASRNLFRDHPRMRGEHSKVWQSSHPSDGIIPACAGSTALTVIRTV